MAILPDELMRAFGEYPTAMVDDNDDMAAEAPPIATAAQPRVSFGLRCLNVDFAPQLCG
jgi:hypothetical protein